MAYLTQKELESLDFKRLGSNVKVSSRASLYDVHLMCLEDNVRIDDFCVVSGNVILQNSVWLAPFCLVAGGSKFEDLQEGGIVIGESSVFSYGVRVFSRSDDYVGTNKKIVGAVQIGRHCVFGANSVVYAGSEVGDYVSVGALSFVKGKCVEYGVYAGIPAQLIQIKSRRGGGDNFGWIIFLCFF
ncbi:acetyltransferase [Helicobacter sp.]|uniref:acyltransferase n=1 Tax=Helicobacter sp. TaxID=218 RepID=UPI0019C8354E|nr:acetyltransferase [Helicobacter sp.]MBD5165441.1 acetyltransferase [Helicobacter sp.]